ncbi:tRNA (32-2'-O)-methyltransferase regulator THADA [Pogona vitticeps]
MNGAGGELERAVACYRELARDEGKSSACQGLLLALGKLEAFASVSAKRWKDKNLEEAFQLLAGVSRRLADLGCDDALRPLVRCVLAFQLETTDSSGSFSRLEKIIVKLSERNESLVSGEVERILGSLAKDDTPMSRGTLQTVSMFVEESTLGRCYWKNNLMTLLGCTAATFDFLLQDRGAKDEAWCYVTVKVCLQLFKWMPKEIFPLIWGGTDHNKILQKILKSLVQIIMEKTACKDTRLLAATALSMMVNTAPDSQQGGQAAWGLCRWLSLGGGPVGWKEDGRVSTEKEEFRFGMLQLVPSVWSPDGWERLALTRSLLASCKKEILSCRLDGTPHQACLLLDILFPVVLDLMEKPLDCHYYCFQVFSLWLERFRESLAEIWKMKGHRVLADNSSLLQMLSRVLWNNAESPVEGVSDFIRSSFELLMEIYSLECDQFEDLERPLYGQFLQRIILMAWQTRARYFALTSILPYLGPGKVLDLYQDLPQHLLNCLSTNHLCPAASDVYKTILQLQRKGWTEGQEGISEEELAQRWARPWLPTLFSALTSPDSFLQSNAGNYLLVWTVRLFPASSALLAGRFSGRDASQLRAWVTVWNVHKALVGTLPEEDETLGRLAACLFSQEDHVRLAALGLLCSTPRTNQALSKREVQLLKEFLPLNLNCDSSSFRQLLQATVKKALVRLRDSALAVLKHQTPNRQQTPTVVRKDLEASLEQAVGFVEWLWQLCVASLTSGPNYQRKKTSLLLLAAILETCTDSWSPERKKGQPPRNMAALLNWARSKGCWDFFSRSHTMTLLSCVLDSTNEIRELASELLVRYFPSPFPESIAAALFERAGEAVSSPRVQEVEAGSMLMKTLLQKSDNSILKQVLPAAKEGVSEQSHCLYFLEHLLSLLHRHFSLACEDLLKAAHTTPIHGVISALRRCLLEVPEVAASMLREQQVHRWQLFLSGLVDALRDICSFLLGVLQNKESSGLDQQAAAPSFADMGNAIGGLIRLGKDLGSQEEDDSVLLSEEHSLVLTCCWVSVKEIGLLFGGLVETFLPLAPPAGCGPLLPIHILNTAAEVFQNILLKCRHWGAVEGCSLGFTKFCTTLLRHPDPELQAIPKAMLAQGLTLLSSPRSCSITRRAAGFPMLFLCIVAGEDPAKSRPLLAGCIQTLLALANEPLPQDWDQTVDLPQVSAVHVLQTLVRGSGLGTALRQHIPPMAVLFLKALSSPSWAMRNAAIQLFAALTVRLLGQKRRRDESRGPEGVSPEALFGCYPPLRTILLGELISAVEASGSRAPQSGKLRLCPSLYAILTFLAKLQPSSDTRNSHTLCFLKPLIQLSSNPIYAVRVMAAKALVPLIPGVEYQNVLLQLVSDLPLADDGLSHNALQGCLLQIQAVLTHALRVSRLSPDVLLSIIRGVEERVWLVTSSQRCPLVRIAYLQVVSLLTPSCSQTFAQHIWEIVSGELADPKPAKKPGFSEAQVGFAAFRQHAVRFLCHEATRRGCPEKAAELCSLLRGGSSDVQVALLTWLLETEERAGMPFCEALWPALLEKLGEVLKDKSDPVLLKLYMEAFVQVYENLSAQNSGFLHKPLGAVHAEHMGILLSIVESDRLGPELLGHMLCVLALLLTLNPEDYSAWEKWSVIIERRSRALSPEVLRMAVAKSLKIAGVPLIRKARESSGSTLQAVALRLLDAGIRLLQDEDQEVRKEASVFASLLMQQQQPFSRVPRQSTSVLLQTNKALLSILTLVREQFGDCPQTFVYLAHHLPTAEARDALTELETKGAVSLYKEDEPNVYAEPAVLSQTLLPFLLQLLDGASTSPELWGPMQDWLKATGPGLFSDLQYCRMWWSRGDVSLHLKALVCPKVQIAVAALLVKAVLAIEMLEKAEGGKLPAAEGIHLSSQDLRCEARSVQKLLAGHGVAPAIGLEQALSGSRS